MSNWQNWGDQRYADVMYRRAIGDLPEMESSKAMARRVASFWQQGNNVLDAGCGAGHYLRSLRREIGHVFDYTGIDITADHLALAKMAFVADKRAHFAYGDIFDLRYRDGEFDIVICTNLLQNLPSIFQPLSELVRVARRLLIIRLLCGSRTFLIRDVHQHEPELDLCGEPYSFNHYNIYSGTYLDEILSRIPGIQSHTIEPDCDYAIENVDNAALAGNPGAGHTTMIGGYQANGYILLPWAFVTIRK